MSGSFENAELIASSARMSSWIPHLPGLGPEGVRILPGGDRVEVDQTIQAVVPVLQRHPVADRAEVVPERRHARWLDAREDARPRDVFHPAAVSAGQGPVNSPAAGLPSFVAGPYRLPMPFVPRFDRDPDLRARGTGRG